MDSEADSWKAISADLLARLAARGNLLVIYEGDYAFTFTDQYGEVELIAYKRTGDQFRWIFNQIDAGMPEYGYVSHGGWTRGHGSPHGYAWRLGRSTGRAVTIEYEGERYEVAVGDGGYWAFIRETSDEHGNSSPRVVA